jgi:hypothetical protein
MQKVLISDLIKAAGDEQLKEDKIKADEWNVTTEELYCMIDISNNEADWDDILLTAESLGLSPCEIDYDDVENYLEMGRENKGELDSSVGPIQWIYDNKLKAYIIYMVLDTLEGPIDIMYKLDPDMLREWMNSDSIGEYYNTYIRSNKEIEDPDNSCGCQDEPCSEELIRSYKARYASIS